MRHKGLVFSHISSSLSSLPSPCVSLIKLDIHSSPGTIIIDLTIATMFRFL